MVQYKQAMGLRRHSGQIVKDMSLIVVGSLLFSVSMNCIILPSGMYSGGFLGIAQLLRMVLLSVFPSLQSVGDVAGIIYFLLNVPLLILAWSRFGHLFFAKTALCVACYSIFLALIPIPQSGLFDEHLTACVIGGLACGAGARPDPHLWLLWRRRRDPGAALPSEAPPSERWPYLHGPELCSLWGRFPVF